MTQKIQLRNSMADYFMLGEILQALRQHRENKLGAVNGAVNEE